MDACDARLFFTVPTRQMVLMFALAECYDLREAFETLKYSTSNMDTSMSQYCKNDAFQILGALLGLVIPTRMGDLSSTTKEEKKAIIAHNKAILERNKLSNWRMFIQHDGQVVEELESGEKLPRAHDLIVSLLDYRMAFMLKHDLGLLDQDEDDKELSLEEKLCRELENISNDERARPQDKISVINSIAKIKGAVKQNKKVEPAKKASQTKFVFATYRKG